MHPGVSMSLTRSAGHVNPSTISRKGNKVRVWDLMDYRTTPDRNTPYLSTKRQTEYDCKELRSRLIFISAYSGNLGKGEIVNTATNTSSDWTPIVPESVGEILWRVACRRRGKSL